MCVCIRVYASGNVCVCVCVGGGGVVKGEITRVLVVSLECNAWVPCSNAEEADL